MGIFVNVETFLKILVLSNGRRLLYSVQSRKLIVSLLYSVDEQ